MSHPTDVTQRVIDAINARARSAPADVRLPRGLLVSIGAIAELPSK